MLQLVPFGFGLVLIGLTAYQADYLSEVGWSPVGRSRTQWPSLLATGPGGWVFIVSVILTGGCTVLTAVAGSRLASSNRQRAVALCVLFVGIALALVGFPADAPDVASNSWHSRIHNAAYPLIPILSLAAISLSSSRAASDDVFRWASRRVLPIALVSFSLTGLDSIAQLSRYFAFASLLLWYACYARMVRVCAEEAALAS